MENDNDNTQSYVPLVKGTKVGHYKIISKIGAGGMGEVYLAEDSKLNRQVALKFMPPQLCSDEDYRNRFKREAQAVAKLDHQNIVTIYEVSEFAGRPYFAMQNIEGKPLRDLVKSETLDFDKIIDLAIQICEGLQEAHEAGIVHRDIKPANIIISKRGRARLLDFGLAAVQGADKLTKTGSTMGTVGYMSPEQIKVKDIDHRSDLFSVGVLLYEMITAKRPFEGDNEAAILNSILNSNPEPMARYKKDVPDELQRIVLKLLEKDVEMRYQAAAGIIPDLKKLKQESELRTISSPEITSKRRYNKIIIPSVVVLIALAVLIFKPWKFEISPRQEAIARENKLAIMYFDNLADPTDSLRYGEITTNLLITDLSESDYVWVVSSQRLYDILKQLGREGEKKVNQDIATQVAQKANARWMLLGSILNLEPEIILTAQLIEVESGNAIASQRIEGQPGERIFPLVDRLTIEIKKDLSLPEEAITEKSKKITDVTTSSVEAYRYYLEGRDLYEKHYWNDARQIFEKALEYDSTLGGAYYYVGAINYWSFNYAAARNWINKALKYSDKFSKKSKLYLNSLHARLEGDYNLAVEELQKVIEMNPDEKGAYVAIGVIKKLLLKEKDDAIYYFDKALELDPFDKESYNQLAYIYDELGQFEKAIWAINKYIEIAPDEANPYDTRGEIYALNGKLDEAIASYEKAMQLKSGFSEIRLANLYLFKKNYSKADSLYRSRLSVNNKNERAFGRLALTRIDIFQGRFKEAISKLEIGIETDKMELGEDWDVSEKLMNKGILNWYIGNISEAIFDIERSIAILRKTDPSFQYINLYKVYLAACNAKNNDFLKADSILDVIKLDSDKTNTLKNNAYLMGRGFVELERNNFDSAVVYWELLNSNESGIFVTQLYLGQSYLKANQIAKAVTILENAMNTYDILRAYWPHLSVLGHYWLGRSYEASGWNDKAVEQYETFLDIWKNADSGIMEMDDARERLAQLKNI